MKKLLLVAIVVAVIVGGGAFYGGMKYAQAGKGNFANLTSEQRQQFADNAGAGLRNGPSRGSMGAGVISGEIISKDDKSVTVKMRDGGSKIVFYSGSTEIGKFTKGVVSDLSIGETVTTNGTANSDGSLTAQSIQIRPLLPSPTPSN
ncbi:MAG: hypothetical protein UW46_C0006G0026 [Candidatus Yanofskybacteria bacterium GW2011_GWF1_44_227]|uniref:DUF5666 domain-containing protein n=1 Tax=Candidatus Yanofskybacteria bacterium GW2011_GWE2_40_11 TaxID=1619033 RepID=A0A0G0T1Q7_9BACT|nr:MAG: hypothetical protein UT69_C0002G0021 [Candidatus Yanofskybacteria bacterium GW2011_GWE1_40_10]KKR41040.1 MAG: hypothetical protein UT75_C0002G0077 [Candidatus Yanofskybacteria bacterium GW2011_GWE2_40_11]KKT15459.1 MAG: hypothetical protein UV97_C0006G0026 [Candidatus Yanofskybacteria bacterium GW2011_GWF2_43_596]KKT53125.1 MAG: hypothetical protein UW46_C0006G0026 [Candidatus Yanofskybacteria bacterium GW2011_GWF1_44_227]OGN35524.1 MAG: hypothetical protein A2207_02170 [Candidatus Yano